MPSLSKSLDALNSAELNRLSKLVSVDCSEHTTAETRKILYKFFLANPDQLHHVPGFETSSPRILEGETIPPTFTMPEDTKPPTSLILDMLKECGRRNIKFSGERSENVNTFIRELDKVSKLFYIDDIYKIQVLKELLSGPAALWIQANFANCQNLVLLVNALKENYKSYCSETQREIDLLQRSQAPGENISSFVACVKVINSRLEKPKSIEDCLRICLSNLHPQYLDVLYEPEPTSFGELERRGAALEKKRAMKDAYHPPPMRLLNDEEFGKVCSPSNQRSEISLINVKGQKLSCWNCLKDGHGFQNCREERRIFCYKCGKQNVYSPDCKCQGN